MIQQGLNILDEINKKSINYSAKLEQINFLDERYYKVSENKYYPSVTSILQYMPKNKFFESWLKDVGYNADIIMRRAAKEGTQVHDAIETLLKGNVIDWIDSNGNAKYNELVWNMILKFTEFWKTYKPELLYCEEFVWSDKFEYAGTGDIVCKLDGEVWLLDTKTSNSLHKSYHLQLAAYAKAIEEQLGLKIERTGILWLKAATRKPSAKKGVYQGAGWQVKAVDDIDENFELFKTIQRLYKLENPKIEPKFKKYPLQACL